MIPQIVHYCWFGRKRKPQSVINLITQWQIILPQYEIKEWNEETFDVTSTKFTNEAYSVGKFAFVSDYVRLHALYNYGGIYLDTDVEVLKNFDAFLNHDLFLGFEGNQQIGTAVIGAEKRNSFLGEFLNYYSNKNFITENGKYNDKPNTHILGEKLAIEGLKYNDTFQIVNNSVFVYPFEYFSARSFLTGEISRTNQTVCIHHFASSWLPWHLRQKLKISYAIKSIKRSLFQRFQM